MKSFPRKLDTTPLEYKKEKKTYVPVHIHSSFSTFDAFSTTSEIAEVASKLGMPAVSLSDHGTMSGVYGFVNKCKEKNIKPIVGCEFYVNEDRLKEEKNTSNQHLCLFAMDLGGYKNLLKILYDALTNGFYYRGRTDLEFVAKNSDNLICTTACQASPIILPFLEGRKKEALSNMKLLKDVFGDRLYVEYQFNENEIQHSVVEWLEYLSNRFKVKGIYGLDSHYTYPNDVYVQDVIKLNRRKITVRDTRWKDSVFTVRRLFIKPYSVALEEPKLLGFGIKRKRVEEILEVTKELADRVNFEMEVGLQAPVYKYMGKKVNAPKFLKVLIEKGFARKLKAGIIPKAEEKKYRQRMEYEYQKILDCGYPNYFLMIWDMVRESMKRGIYRGIGRGSASGSLVSFLLDINGVNPIKHGLLFERFMDIERKDPPDIDLDWESERRDDVEAYLKEKYGEERVARISTYSNWGTKSALNEVFKTLGEDSATIKEMSRWIRMDEGDNRDDKGITEALEWLRENCRDDKVLEMIDRQTKLGIPLAQRLVNNVRNFGLHPGGVVVSPEPIFNYIPVVRHNNVIITGFSQGSDGRTELEDIGLIKIDNLGVNAVSVVKETIRLVKERTGRDLDKEIWNLDLEDKSIYKYYRNGYTEGIFQVESEEINRFIKRLKPESFEDLRAIVALFRPGGLTTGEADRFIKRKHGKEKVVYVHPILEKYLGVTHGCFLYQEQLMQIMHELAGFSRGEVLKYMKLLKKSYDIKDKRVLTAINRLKKGLIELSNFTEEQAEKLKEIMRKCYAYIFNKSHSTAYALFSYQMMWLKRHYPLEFFCALLTRTENKKTEHKGGTIKLKMKRYINGAAKLGIKVLPPKFGVSSAEFKIESESTIRAGNRVIVGIGKSALELDKTKVGTSFEGFVCNEEISWRRLNRSKVAKLINLGFFEGCVLTEPTIKRKQLHRAWQLFNEARKGKRNKKVLVKAIKDAMKEVSKEYSRTEILEFQIDGFRFFFYEHPLESKEILTAMWEYNKVQKKKTLKILKVSKFNRSGNKRGTIVGYISSIKITSPKKGISAGESMAIVTLEDKDGKAKILVWPEFYGITSYRKKLKEGNILILRVKRKSGDSFQDIPTYELSSMQDKSHMISVKDLVSKTREKERKLLKKE